MKMIDDGACQFSWALFLLRVVQLKTQPKKWPGRAPVPFNRYQSRTFLSPVFDSYHDQHARNPDPESQFK